MPPSSQFPLSFKYPTEVARDLWVARGDIWDGIAVGFQRDYLRKAAREPTSMPDAKRYLNSTGIYILRGKDPLTYSTRIYVGKGTRVGDRLQNHARPGNDWWTEAVAIISKHGEWDSSQASFIEAQLYDLAVKARHCVLMNDNRPGGDDLTDHKWGVAEEIFKGIERCLPALGYPEFIVSGEAKPSRKRGASASRSASTRSSSSSASVAPPVSPKSRKATASARTTAWDCPPEAEFRMTYKSLSACARRDEEGRLIVLRNSEAMLRASDDCSTATLRRRRDLIDRGQLKQVGERLVFQEDVRFEKPSPAAEVVRGRATNGNTAWRTRDGKRLGDL